MKLVTIGIGDDTDGVHDCPKILDDENVDSGPTRPRCGAFAVSR
ncbi:MAG: hypothetical protein ACRDSL_21920 [Pseudonocardiaceae bacterium]